jgi:hypothetical protein
MPTANGETRVCLNTYIRNWPDAIKNYRIRGVHAESLTTTERNNLRKVNVQTATITSDGTVYMAIGGGVASSETSAEAVMRAATLWSDVEQLGIAIETQSEKFLRICEMAGTPTKPRSTQLRCGHRRGISGSLPPIWHTLECGAGRRLVSQKASAVPMSRLDSYEPSVRMLLMCATCGLRESDLTPQVMTMKIGGDRLFLPILDTRRSPECRRRERAVAGEFRACQRRSSPEQR